MVQYSESDVVDILPRLRPAGLEQQTCYGILSRKGPCTCYCSVLLVACTHHGLALAHAKKFLVLDTGSHGAALA